MSLPTAPAPGRNKRLMNEVFKHLCVLGIMCFEILPIYMMLQISVKDNTTFIKNHFLPANPWIPNEKEMKTGFQERVAYKSETTGEPVDEILFGIIYDEKMKSGYQVPATVADLAVQLQDEAKAGGEELTPFLYERAWSFLSTSKWRWSNYNFGVKLIAPYVANTVFIAVLSAVGTLFFSLMGAYFFARYKMPGSTPLWMAFMFLMLMPGIANIVTLFALLKHLNLLNTLWALIIVHTAGGQVFNMFVLRNFIEDIPKDLFEAAEMDGASHFQQMMHIVVPMSGSILGTLAIFLFIGSWNEYLLPLIVLDDQELFTLGVGLIYLDGEYVKRWGLIMSAFFVASIPLIIIFLFTMKLFIRGLAAGAVKG